VADNQTTDHGTGTYQCNVPARVPRDFLNDAGIQAFAENAEETTLTFYAADMEFFVRCIQNITLCNENNLDENDLDALSDGYKCLISLAAINKKDLKIYGIYEYYSRDDGVDDYLSKAIDIDCNFQRRGIGTAFLTTIRDNEIKAKPSGKYTLAGAAFLNSLT